jgi:hypothetical protein
MSAEDETYAELVAALDASHYGISEAGTCHGCDDFWPCPPARASYVLARVPGLLAAAWDAGVVVGDDPWGVPSAKNPYRD